MSNNFENKVIHDFIIVHIGCGNNIKNKHCLQFQN